MPMVVWDFQPPHRARPQPVQGRLDLVAAAGRYWGRGKVRIGGADERGKRLRKAAAHRRGERLCVDVAATVVAAREENRPGGHGVEVVDKGSETSVAVVGSPCRRKAEV